MAAEPQRRPTLSAAKSRFDRAASLDSRLDGQLNSASISQATFSRKPAGLKIQKAVGEESQAAGIPRNRRGTLNQLELFKEAQLVSAYITAHAST